MSVLIIAEAGVNHNGDIKLARQLVDVAVEAGADLVKFQTFRADRLVTTSAKKAPYQMVTTAAEESQHEMIRRLELTEEMHDELIAYCRERKIEFFSTAFDQESLDYLMGLGMARIKVPSGEITNLPYLRKVGGLGKEVILSTGMSNLGEIEAAIDSLEKAGTPRERVFVLHCNTEYPVPMPEVNLRAMRSIREAFGVKVGFSDHTEGIEIAIAAVALGAKVIEKHFTLDRNLSGPDHRASIEPDDLGRMIRSIRNVELAMGDGIKRPSMSEEKNRPVVRKSLVASRHIAKGDVFSHENITVKRPGTGISPMRFDEVLGCVATRDFSPDEIIEI